MKNVPGPCACSSIRRAARILTRAYDNTLSPAGINGTQLSIMRAVRRNPEASMAAIAIELSMDRTTFYRALAPLKRKGWIEILDKESGPAKKAVITSSGRSVLARSAPLWDELQTSIIGKFGKARWAKLVSELKRLEDCVPDHEN